MVYSQHLKSEISVIRVLFDFYPMKGGSITHATELSKKINPYLKNQVIIAPDFGDGCKGFDDALGIPVRRVKYPRVRGLNYFKYLKLPVLPFILYGYAYEVLGEIKNMNYSENTLLYVHGTMLGAILSALNKIYHLKIPLIVLQDSGNLFNISIRDTILACLSFNLLKIFVPEKLIIVDDGMGVDKTKNLCIKYSIPCEIVCHSIDTDLFRPNNSRKDGKFIVLSNHRLEAFKRVDIAILAFKKFLEYIGYGNDVKLLIIGGGSELGKLLELAKTEELGSYVEFVGEKSTNEVIDLINSSDVVVGTSLQSNLNLSIQEAMACQKAVIVFDSGEIKKLVKDMKNGILTPPNDLEKFAEKLEHLYKNPELIHLLGQNAKKTIVEERSWETRVRRELNTYEEIYSRKDNKQ